jgi:hypothetical protein
MKIVCLGISRNLPVYVSTRRNVENKYPKGFWRWHISELVSYWNSSIIEFQAKHDVPETGSLSSLREKVGSTCSIRSIRRIYSQSVDEGAEISSE